jgi:GLPGLI family protein
MTSKTILILIACIALSNKSQAQFTPNYVNLDKYKVLDSAYLKCSYKLTYLRDSTKQNIKSKDTQTLLIGKTVSKYYSQEILDWNYYIKKNFENQTSYPNIKNDGVWATEVFKNYPQGKETVTNIGSMIRGNYVYEEDVPVFDWKITNERQTILSYNCQKATVLFRGREFIAWFTTDIPVPNGPWKFGGLPGLILKLHDSKNNFIFECSGIEQLKKKEPVKYYQVEYTKISLMDWNKLNKRYYDDIIKYENSFGTIVIIVDPATKKETKHTSFKLPYNPIELE